MTAASHARSLMANPLGGLIGSHARMPVAIPGGWLGWRLYGTLGGRQVRRLLAGLIAASGAALLI